MNSFLELLLDILNEMRYNPIFVFYPLTSDRYLISEISDQDSQSRRHIELLLFNFTFSFCTRTIQESHCQVEIHHIAGKRSHYDSDAACQPSEYHHRAMAEAGAQR